MTDKVIAPGPIPQIVALRELVRKLRRKAARKLCPNPLQVLRVADLLNEIADSIEAIVTAGGLKAAVAPT